MKRDCRRWKNYKLIRVAQVTAWRLRRLVPQATSYAEAVHVAVEALATQRADARIERERLDGV